MSGSVALACQIAHLVVVKVCERAGVKDVSRRAPSYDSRRLPVPRDLPVIGFAAAERGGLAICAVHQALPAASSGRTSVQAPAAGRRPDYRRVLGVLSSIATARWATMSPASAAATMW